MGGSKVETELGELEKSEVREKTLNFRYRKFSQHHFDFTELNINIQGFKKSFKST